MGGSVRNRLGNMMHHVLRVMKIVIVASLCYDLTWRCNQ